MDEKTVDLPIWADRRPATWADLMLVVHGTGLKQLYCGSCGFRSCYSLVSEFFGCRGCNNSVSKKEIIKQFRSESGLNTEKFGQVSPPRFFTGTTE